MNCSRNDVVLLPIPFTDLTTKKVRPGVVVGKTFTDLFLVPISSKLANTDSPIGDWRLYREILARKVETLKN